MRYVLSCAVGLAFATAAVAADKAVPTEPVTKPDWAKVRATAESGMKGVLFDPGSAQIVYTSGFQWGYMKALLGSKKWGWVACGQMNAKNRMGGYVGATAFTVRADAQGAVTWNMDGTDLGTCNVGSKVDLQSELRDPVAEKAAGDARLGIAEELIKLAELRDKGIITAAEFEAQKAKLLAR